MIVAGMAFIVSVAAVPLAILERELRFVEIAVCELAAYLCGAATTIALALNGVGLMSLAIGPVVSAGMTTLLLSIVTRFVPSERPRRGDARDLWAFSSGLVKFNMSNYGVRNVDNLGLSRFASQTQLGLYSRAYTLTIAPVIQVGSIVGRVLFPVLARHRDEPSELRARWQRVSLPTTALMAYLSVLIAFCTSPLTAALLGTRWSSIAGIWRILTLSAVPQVLCATLGCVFQAYGQTQRLFRVNGVQLICVVIGVAVGLRWAATGVAWGVTAAYIVSLGRDWHQSGLRRWSALLAPRPSSSPRLPCSGRLKGCGRR
jgi:O-antigen/teichoic acid export membrane protein